MRQSTVKFEEIPIGEYFMFQDRIHKKLSDVYARLYLGSVAEQMERWELVAPMGLEPFASDDTGEDPPVRV